MTMILEVLHNVMKSVTLTSALNLALKAVKLISKNTVNLAESEKASKILVKMLARMKSMLENEEISTEVKAKDSVFGSLLLTGAVIISEVKLKALPHLTWVINQVIDGIGQTQSDQMRLILMVSLCKILESMSQFISPYLESIIKILCLFDPRQQTDLGFRVTKTIEIVSQTSSRLFLPAVSNIYGQMDNNRITSLLYIVERHIDAVDKTTAVKQQANLQRFFIEALEFRTKNKEGTDRIVIQNIEQATCQALVRLALKLPEASLRNGFISFRTHNRCHDSQSFFLCSWSSAIDSCRPSYIKTWKGHLFIRYLLGQHWQVHQPADSSHFILFIRVCLLLWNQCSLYLLVRLANILLTSLYVCLSLYTVYNILYLSIIVMYEF